MWSKLSVKGQLVVPKALRDALEWLPGDQLELELTEVGDLAVRKPLGKPVLRLRGFLAGGEPLAEDVVRDRRAEIASDMAEAGALVLREDKGVYQAGATSEAWPAPSAVTLEEFLARRARAGWREGAGRPRP
ncbi:MAG: AbrB/MazE/SpoVT family DNA-binding domain-containing protein [Chloroflexota bacterium]